MVRYVYNKCIIVFLIFVVFLSSCGSKRIIFSDNEGIDWVLVDSKIEKEEHWKIYYRELDEKHNYEYMFESSLSLSPKICLELFRESLLDVSSNNPKNKDLKSSILINTDKEILVYSIKDEPFIFKDTEMCVSYEFNDNLGLDGLIRWKENWNKCNVVPSKKLKRVMEFRGSWRFTQIGTDHSKVRLKVSFDTQGMPMFLVRPMVKKYMIESFKIFKINRK